MKNWIMTMLVVTWALFLGVLLNSCEKTDPTDPGTFELPKPTTGPADTWWVMPDTDASSFPLGNGLPKARTYNLFGVEVEGTYWWWCDKKWVQIEPPCEVP